MGCRPLPLPAPLYSVWGGEDTRGRPCGEPPHLQGWGWHRAPGGSPETALPRELSDFFSMCSSLAPGSGEKTHLSPPTYCLKERRSLFPHATSKVQEKLRRMASLNIGVASGARDSCCAGVWPPDGPASSKQAPSSPKWDSDQRDAVRCQGHCPEQGPGPNPNPVPTRHVTLTVAQPSCASVSPVKWECDKGHSLKC